MRSRQRRLFKRNDEFELKELKNTATADREGVARHPVLIELCNELQLLGFSPFAIAEGLAIKANTLRAEGQAQLTSDE
ncbi:MAG: hypothetical protein GKR90_27455 [Pseudomonadales bacterium]|nr:hypothetical protein [Pseudomonadales bacterium]